MTVPKRQIVGFSTVVIGSLIYELWDLCNQNDANLLQELVRVALSYSRYLTGREQCR